MKSKIDYTGDDLNLSKAQIMDTLDQVGSYWSRDRIGNAKRLLSLSIFKGLVKMTSDRDLEDIFKIMLKFIDELRYENFKAGGSTEATTLKVIKKSLAEEIFNA